MGWADCGSWWLVGLLLASTKLLGAAGSIAWLPGQYPNPIKYPEACGRGDAVGWICDPDNVLPKEEADSAAALLQDISAATPPYPQAYCPQQGHDGYPVAVALVKKLGTRFGRPMNVEAAYFADSLYNAWQMEHKDCRNGILLAISVEDREAHLRVGSKLEAVLSRAKLNSIAQSAKKRAAVGDISGAVKGAMHETAILLVGYARPQVPIDPRRAWGLSLFFFGSSGIALMGVYRCWLWLGRRRTRRASH